MNYGQLKKQVMQLVFSESIAGNEIPVTYNNQADYIRAIPGLANDCMMYIATTVKKIPEVVPLKSLKQEDFGAYTLYTMPRDFWRLNNGGLIWQRPDVYNTPRYSYQRFHGYKLYANNRLMIANNVPNLDQMMVEYYRSPRRLGMTPTISPNWTIPPTPTPRSLTTLPPSWSCTTTRSVIRRCTMSSRPD